MLLAGWVLGKRLQAEPQSVSVPDLLCSVPFEDLPYYFGAFARSGAFAPACIKASTVEA